MRVEEIVEVALRELIRSEGKIVVTVAVRAASEKSAASPKKLPATR